LEPNIRWHIFEICSAVRFLGIIQRSMTLMYTVVVRFGIVFGIILLGFSQSFHFVIRDTAMTTVSPTSSTTWENTTSANTTNGASWSMANATATVMMSKDGDACLNSIWYTVFVMYQLMLGDGPSCTMDRIRDATSVAAGVTPMLLYVFYTLTTVLLLLNLLIAVFNDTYTEVKENAEMEWRATWATTIMRIQDKLPLQTVHPWCTGVLATCTIVEEKPSAEQSAAEEAPGTRERKLSIDHASSRKRSYTVADYLEKQKRVSASDLGLAGVVDVDLDSVGAQESASGGGTGKGTREAEPVRQHLDRMDMKVEMLDEAHQQLGAKLTKAQQDLDAKLTRMQQNLDDKLTQVLAALSAGR
jgi:hypothetical protein